MSLYTGTESSRVVLVGLLNPPFICSAPAVFPAVSLHRCLHNLAPSVLISCDETPDWKKSHYTSLAWDQFAGLTVRGKPVVNSAHLTQEWGDRQALDPSGPFLEMCFPGLTCPEHDIREPTQWVSVGTEFLALSPLLTLLNHTEIKPTEAKREPGYKGI